LIEKKTSGLYGFSGFSRPRSSFGRSRSSATSIAAAATTTTTTTTTEKTAARESSPRKERKFVFGFRNAFF